MTIAEFLEKYGTRTVPLMVQRLLRSNFDGEQVSNVMALAIQDMMNDLESALQHERTRK